MGIELNRDQAQALFLIQNWWERHDEQVFELSGVSGAGKTFLVNFFIDSIGLDISDCAFTAFMGKAAMVMARNGLPAQTIHSLIYDYVKVPILDDEGHYQFDDKNKVIQKWIFRKKETLQKDYKLIVVDEASMVSAEIAQDLLSYNIPVIAMGDLNQLPPVIGGAFFLTEPNYHLTQIMRQEEGNPIIYLSQCVLNNRPLEPGTYGDSIVFGHDTKVTRELLKKHDITLTYSNKMRGLINNFYRKEFYRKKQEDNPVLGERVICRKNNWKRTIDHILFLTNGMAGEITYIDDQNRNSQYLTIDFHPDFLPPEKQFRNLKVDLPAMKADPGAQNDGMDKYNQLNKFEYAYAITTHLSQGSQYGRVLLVNESRFQNFPDNLYKKLQYTAITRAIDKITIIL